MNWAYIRNTDRENYECICFILFVGKCGENSLLDRIIWEPVN
jgi:hypothetical protein